jgi:H+/gluconate symporter-like permease
MYMKWGNPELAPLIGLAWDCGAVTTGPVTVPILLSLGVGVIKGQKEKAKHAAEDQSEEAQAHKKTEQQLEGFGIITLASMFPILAVSLMSIVISMIHSPEVSHKVQLPLSCLP